MSAIFPILSGGPSSSPPDMSKLPVRHQEDLISGLQKYAQLSLDEHGKPCFRGTGYGRYYTESYAECHVGGAHEAPQPDCTCGFWVPYREESRLAQWSSSQVRLEVEIGGRILNCSRVSKKETWGYRAQWQRVLSVTLNTTCGASGAYGRNACAGKARWLCVQPGYANGHGSLISACIVHMRRSSRVIGEPVSWLRRELRTEIRPGDVTDKLPADDQKRLGAIDSVAREQYPVAEILKAVTMPPDPPLGDLFRVCVDVKSKMTYEFAFTTMGWQVNAIYHPTLAAWGWGSPYETE
jgi:hypothetical protein